MAQWPAWTYDSQCASNKDPINIIFEVGLLQLVTEFKDPSRKWRNPPKYFGVIPTVTNQYLCHRGVAEQQDEQLIKGSLADRLHIRLWKQNRGATVGSAHHEYGLSLGIVPPKIYYHHHPEFERGKWRVEEDFKTTRTVEHDAIYLDNACWDPFSNGYATRIV